MTLVVEQDAAPSVERTPRRRIGRLDAQRLAQVTQQRRRHGADAVQRPPA